jgi:hypothetical protein
MVTRGGPAGLLDPIRKAGTPAPRREAKTCRE